MSDKGYRSQRSTGRVNRLSPMGSKPADKQALPGRLSLLNPHGCASPSSHCRKEGIRGAVMNDKKVAGIDVSKSTLDVALLPAGEMQVGNDAAGIDELLKRLKAARLDLVVMEATGGYETAVAS